MFNDENDIVDRVLRSYSDPNLSTPRHLNLSSSSTPSNTTSSPAARNARSRNTQLGGAETHGTPRGPSPSPASSTPSNHRPLPSSSLQLRYTLPPNFTLSRPLSVKSPHERDSFSRSLHLPRFPLVWGEDVLPQQRSGLARETPADAKIITHKLYHRTFYPLKASEFCSLFCWVEYAYAVDDCRTVLSAQVDPLELSYCSLQLLYNRAFVCPRCSDKWRPVINLADPVLSGHDRLSVDSGPGQ